MKKLQLFLMCLILCLSFASPLLARNSSSGSVQYEQSEPPEKVGGVESLEKRVKELEEAIKGTEPTGRWFDRITISGLIEVEAGYGKTEVKDSDDEDEETSDIDLSNVELYVDAKITENVEGHLNIKYEDDEIFLDEGFIMLTGTERFPAYLIAGRQYVPFGNFETFFVTDPNTLILGETNEGAAVAGYRIGEKLVDISVGAFNGRAQTEGDDDTINSFVAAVTTRPLEGLNLGISYTSNLAASNSFNDEVVDPDGLDSLVGAWSAFVTYEFLERFTLIGEYVGAIDSFKAGEIYAADDGKERKPEAWNVELGATLIDDLSVALRYGGSNDGGTAFLPEVQYGAVVNWGFFKNTNLAVEYSHGDFEDDYQDTDTVTAQLAVEF